MPGGGEPAGDQTPPPQQQWIAFFDAAGYHVGISVEDLARHQYDDICYSLSMELAPLDTWRRVALEYHKRGKFSEFENVLETATSKKANEAYRDSIHQSDGTVYQKDRQIRELQENERKIMTALAAYEVQQIEAEIRNFRSMQGGQDGKKRELRKSIQKHEETAIRLIDSASGLRENIYPGTIVCRGLLFLVKDNIGEAEKIFNMVKNDHADFIPAILGLACTQFHQGKYEASLRWYQRALRVNAEACAPSVRVGVGFCLFRLKRYNRAREAFQRALNLDRFNVEAMAGLATVLINNKETEEGAMARAIELLKRAYDLDSTNPMVLNLLAFVSFYQGAYDEVNILARRAYRLSQSSSCKAEALYQMARLLHARGQPKQAGPLYQQATSSDPKHALAQFGLAQTLILNGEQKEAIKILESIQKRGFVGHHASRILGTLYIRQATEKKGKAKASETTEMLMKGQKCLRKALKYFSDDESILIELAQAFEITEPQESYKCYKKAMECLTSKGAPVPFQLWNNLGVLSQRLGKTTEARKSLEAAELLSKKQYVEENSDEKDESSSSSNPALVTITYNKALLDEQEGKMQEAAEAYKGLIKKYPHYVDAHLRLGCEARADGRHSDAEEHFQHALKLEPANQEARGLLGSLFIAMGNEEAFDKAEGCFDEMLKVSKHDAYANLSLADIYMRRMNNLLGKKSPEAIKKSHGQFTKAKEKFYEVLKMYPNNMYAGNGFGAVFAHLKKWPEAKQTLQMVKDANKSSTAVHVNLGHVYTQQSMYPTAIGAYEVALKGSAGPEDRVEILGYIARAQYLMNKTEQCKRTLAQALRLDPTDNSLKYNLGVTLEDHAVFVLTKKKEERTLIQVRKAHTELKQAMDIFNELHTRLKDSADDAEKYIAEKAGSHYAFCKDSMMKADRHLEDAEKRDRRVQEKRKIAAENAEKLRRKKAEEEHKKELENEEKQKELEERYRAEQSKMEDLTNNEIEAADGNPTTGPSGDSKGNSEVPANAQMETEGGNTSNGASEDPAKEEGVLENAVEDLNEDDVFGLSDGDDAGETAPVEANEGEDMNEEDVFGISDDDDNDGGGGENTLEDEQPDSGKDRINEGDTKSTTENVNEEASQQTNQENSSSVLNGKRPAGTDAQILGRRKKRRKNIIDDEDDEF